MTLLLAQTIYVAPVQQHIYELSLSLGSRQQAGSGHPKILKVFNIFKYVVLTSFLGDTRVGVIYNTCDLKIQSKNIIVMSLYFKSCVYKYSGGGGVN